MSGTKSNKLTNKKQKRYDPSTKKFEMLLRDEVNTLKKKQQYIV